MTLSKAAILDVVRQMPDDVDVEELLHRIVLLQKLAASEADVEAGRTYSQAEVREQVAQWRK